MSMFSDEELKTVAEIVGRNTGKEFDLNDPELRLVVSNEFLNIGDGEVIDRIQEELEKRGITITESGESSVPTEQAVTLSPEVVASLGEGDEPTRGISTLKAPGVLAGSKGAQ